MIRPSWGVVLIVGVLASLALWLGVRQLAWMRDYREAEALVVMIWPMADEMKRFADEQGRPPQSVSELAVRSAPLDFHTIASYPHEFTARGPRRFFLRANGRFAFAIDAQFEPAWIVER